MISNTITLINKLGLHARASAKFVAVAGRFQSSLEVDCQSKTVNGKSIMGVMMLGAKHGSELTLRMEGPDEVEMEQAMLALINNRFGEEE